MFDAEGAVIAAESWGGRFQRGVICCSTARSLLPWEGHRRRSSVLKHLSRLSCRGGNIPENMESQILIVAVLIGIIPGAIASNKGHSFVLWWLFGAAIFIVAFPLAILLKPNQESVDRTGLAADIYKKCPFCAEVIKREAIVCRFCGHELSAESKKTALNDVPTIVGSTALQPYEDPFQKWQQEQTSKEKL